ncbi:MAG: alpha/beta fold hydrolase BchO [Pseudomonadota bacterium]|nr:alpha/beta fold hydrolase BchO [Pseudomonadota bacterium]
MDWVLDAENWPYRENSQFVKVRPYNWHYQEFGGKSKPVALLLHGTGSSTHSWRLLVPHLLNKFRVIAVDLPGHGFTRFFDSNRCTIDNMAEDLSAFLENIKIRPNLIVGHSAGAALAMRLTLDKLSLKVKLVSINGVLDNYFQGLSAYFYPLLAKFLTISPFAISIMALLTKNFNQTRTILDFTGSQIDEEGFSYYKKLFSDAEHMKGTISMMSRWKLGRLENELSEIKNPVLFLIGENDKIVNPETAKKYHQRIQNSQIKRLANLGHLMHEEYPEKISEVIVEFFYQR